MALVRTPKTSFRSGEVSPVINQAIETEVYTEGVKICENYMIDVVSGALNRPGTQYIDDAYDTTKKSRLIPFQFNEEQAYVLEFSNTKFRILKDGGLVGAPTVVTTPYSDSDIIDIDYASSEDKLYIFHPNFSIGEITRTSDTAWTINAGVPLIPRYPWKVRESGDEDIRMNLKYIGLIAPFYDDEWEVIASSPVFGDTLVGDAFKVAFPIPGQPDSLHWKKFAVKTVTSTTILRLRTWESGTVSSPVRPLTYEQIQNNEFNKGLLYWQDFCNANSTLTFDHTNQAAVLTDGAAGDAKMEQIILTFPRVKHILKIKLFSLTGATPQARISVGTSSFGGELLAPTAITDTNNHFYDILPTQETIYINIDSNGSTDGDIVKIESLSFTQIDTLLAATPEYNTNDWRLTAWNANLGFPSVGTIKDQRMYVANSPSFPQTIWASVLGDYLNFDEGTPVAQTDGFSFKPSTQEVNGIKWLIEKDGLKAGTSGAIYRIFTPSGGSLSPSDVAIDVDSAQGSLPLKPITAHNAILMTPRGQEAVLELLSSLESKGFETKDISTKANHLFKNRRIIRWAFAKDPFSVVWVILDNGQLLGFTYHRRNDIWAWHRHTCPLGAGYADVAVIPNSSDDNIDDVYFVINRGTVDSPNYYLEIQNARITPQEAAYGLSASGSPYDYRFLDSALTLDDPKTISGITQAVQGVVSATAHGFSDGDDVRIQNVVGMIEVNNQVYEVSDKTANDFKIKDPLTGSYIDTTGFTAYISGGEARKMVTAISGLDHLEGETVTALADGAAREGLVVSGGAITLPQSASFIHVGLPYTGKIETLDIETIFQTGGTQGRIKGISSTDIYFVDSRDLKIYTTDRPDEIRIVEFEDEAFGEEPPPLFEGIKETDVNSDHDKSVSLVMVQDKPYPSHITRVIVDVDYAGQ